MVPAKQSSLFSRKLVNLFAGMAHGAPTLPRVFVDNGYIVQSLERTFTVEPGKKVNPELILASSALGHTILLEAKSGANLSTDQLDRYASVTSTSLLNGAFVSREASQTHNVLLIGLSSYQSRLMQSSAILQSAARVIGIAHGLPSGEVLDDSLQSALPLGDDLQEISGLSLVENKLLPDAVDAAFRPALEVEWDSVPVNFLPVDHESEDWEFAERFLPELVARILSGSPRVKIAELGEAVIDLWALFIGDYKKQMTRRIERVVKQAAQTRFSNFIKFGERGSSKSEILINIPPRLIGKADLLRTSLLRQARLLLEDLQSPQIAMVYDPNAIDLAEQTKDVSS